MNVQKFGNFQKIGLIQSFNNVRQKFGIREFYKGVGLATVIFNLSLVELLQHVYSLLFMREQKCI
jgi:hypothetical protein